MALPIGAIAGAIEAGAKLWNTWLVSADRRALEKVKDLAVKYIHCNTDYGTFKGQSLKQKNSRLANYSKGLFNNV